MKMYSVLQYSRLPHPLHYITGIPKLAKFCHHILTPEMAEFMKERYKVIHQIYDVRHICKQMLTVASAPVYMQFILYS